MFKIRYAFLIAFGWLLACFQACKQEYLIYDTEAGINFYFPQATDTLVHYSFVYAGSETEYDTVWIQVETIGNLDNSARSVRLNQYETGANDAVSGIHYVPFDDIDLQDRLIVPANAPRASLPIILKRDPSLKTGTYILALELVPNEQFKFVNYKRHKMKIQMTDQLAKPNNWAYMANYVLGTYGPVKHQWLIDHTEHRWDDDFLANELGFTSSSSYPGTNANYDSPYISYFIGKIRALFAAYAQERADQGLEPLAEADGTLVSF